MLDVNSRFSQAPVNANIQRSTFPRKCTHKLTMTSGYLYPVFVDEVLPGDTYVMDTRVFNRMSTPIHPVMDNCYMDVYYFYVPYRLVWDHWKEFMGQPSDDPYADPTEYTIPAIKPFLQSNGTYDRPCFKSCAEYMGIPPGQGMPTDGVTALPFRAFAKVWNDWFRSETIFPAIEFSTGDEDQYLAGYGDLDFGSPYDMEQVINYNDPFDGDGDPDFTFVGTCAYGGYLPPVAKFHDYFTSALREPQRGDPVPIPLSGFAPVVPLNQTIDNYDDQEGTIFGLTTKYSGIELSEYEGDVNADGYGYPLTLSNSFADLGQLKKYSSIVANISDLRYAFQMQKFLEAENRYGTRYTELLRGHFGVTAPDASLQRPELLGGKRIRLNMNQVLQTSSTDSTSPQGNTAGYSATLNVSSSFSKSFVEHGVVLGVACVRVDHTYSQGVEKFWRRKDKFDFYFPQFAHISEQPILNSEIFCQGTAADNEVFGFQEAYADYRYKPNRVSGEFRSTYPQSLDSWHYGDYYTELPTLSADWLRESPYNVNRTLAVSSELADQFLVDFYFDLTAVRPMPVFSVPGLADHF